ncbi:MAG: peptidoglycan recognition protein family protein [Pyrinomonadaceae bacterium]
MSKLSNRILLYAPATAVLTLVALFFTISYLNSIAPAGIIIHHSAVAPPFDGTPVDAPTIDRIHKRRGYEIFYWGKFYNIGYHYVILPDGTVQKGRPELLQGSHTEGYNSYIGICLVGNFSSADNAAGSRGLSTPTEAQINALIELCRSLQQRYNFPPERILRHSDVSPKSECPGDRFPFEEFRARLKTSENR